MFEVDSEVLLYTNVFLVELSIIVLFLNTSRLVVLLFALSAFVGGINLVIGLGFVAMKDTEDTLFSLVAIVGKVILVVTKLRSSFFVVLSGIFIV